MKFRDKTADSQVLSPASGCALKNASLSRLEPRRTMRPPSRGPLGARFNRPCTHWRPFLLGDWSTCGQAALGWRSSCGSVRLAPSKETSSLGVSQIFAKASVMAGSLFGRDEENINVWDSSQMRCNYGCRSKA